MVSSKIKRRDIIGRLVEVPKKSLRPFWQREMTLLKKLEGQYPIEFLNVVSVPDRVPSLAIFFVEPMAGRLRSWHNEFNYKPRIQSPEKVDFCAEKIGEDLTIASKPKTIKDFLK